MGDQAHQLFEEATDAYLTGDATRAAALADMDSYLDDLQRQYIQTIFESHFADRLELKSPYNAMVARFYERIGDHAVNIGERERYLVTGRLPEHEHAATPPLSGHGERPRLNMREPNARAERPLPPAAGGFAWAI